jgi:hypothetical protein
VQGGFDLRAHGFGREDSSLVGHPVRLVPDEPALCEDVGSPALRHRFQSAANDFFRVAEAIDGGGIDPVDAQFNGMLDRPNRLLVILGTPAMGPAASAEGPGTEAHARYLHIRLSKFSPGKSHASASVIRTHLPTNRLTAADLLSWGVFPLRKLLLRTDEDTCQKGSEWRDFWHPAWQLGIDEGKVGRRC